MDPPAKNKADTHTGETLPTTTELFSSAKLVADAAQGCFQGGAENLDKGKVAGAARDLLGAASHYGKLEEKGYGEYIEKAETYLEQYSSGGSAPAPDAAAAPAPPAAAPAAAPDSSTTAPAADEAKTTDGGYGEAVKLAEGLLGGGGGEAGKSEGSGGLLKLAGGFFK